MSKRLMMLCIRGKQHEWMFVTKGDMRDLEQWLHDGIQIYPIVNIIPKWVVDSGLRKPWCFLQDVFNFKNPWSKS